MIDVTHPVTGAVVGRVPRAGAADVARAIERLRATPRALPAPRRGEILRAAAAALARVRDRFARRITDEAGLCVAEAGKEVDRACGNLAVAAEEAVRIHGEAIQLATPGGGKVAVTIHEPVGLVAAITPFNRPLNQVVVKVAPAIAAGAPIVVKPSELTPLSAIAFAELLAEVGLPPGWLEVVTGDPVEVGEALVTSPAVDMVTFTGSVETGRRIMAKIGLKKVLLELGGNDPLIVLADADLARAAALAAAGAFATAGQACRGVKRVIAIDAIADRLAEAIGAAAGELRRGDLYDPATEVSALISADAAARVERRCRAAIGDGARLVTGGGRDGARFEPTVLDHVAPHSELVVEETFGPVAPILRVRDLDAAIAVANATRYGLQAGVVTRDLDAFMHLARRLEVGAVNAGEGPQFDSPHIPFGGVKHSGLGREGIRWAIREMMTLKTVVLPW